MALSIYQIVKEGNQVLREQAKPIGKINDAAIRLLDNLRDTLRDTPKGVGLAAPQIGISKRAFVVEIAEEGVYYEMINPVLSEAEGVEEAWEGCLSVPGLEGLIPRAGKLRVTFTDREGKPCEIVAEGFLARIVQHEYDHLDGVLFNDKATSFREPETQSEQPGEDAGGKSPA